jgi:hypothetical protein
MSTLRIRPDNGTIRELNLPKDILEVLQNVVSSPRTTDDIKKLMIKKFAQVSPCCICGGIPTYEVVYDADGATRVERYCDPCSERVFSRNAVL